MGLVPEDDVAFPDTVDYPLDGLLAKKVLRSGNCGDLERIQVCKLGVEGPGKHRGGVLDVVVLIVEAVVYVLGAIEQWRLFTRLLVPGLDLAILRRS